MKTEDIEISKIKFRGNIRQKFNEADDIALMQSIRDNGLLQPIGVSINEDDTYTIIWGNRRLYACKKLGYKKIPAVIFAEKNEELSEQDFFVTNVIENLQRKPNTLFELGRICKILQQNGLSPSEIAVRLSIPKARVKYALDEIGNVPKQWLKKIQLMETGKTEKEGKIPITTAMTIGRFRGVSQEQKSKLLEYVSKNDAPESEIRLIGKFLKQGLTLAQAIQTSKKYKLFELKVFVDKEKSEELSEVHGNMRDVFMNTLNATYPNLVIRTSAG